MQRWFRLSLMTLALSVLLIGSSSAQTKVKYLGNYRIAKNEVRVFSKDTVYVIHKDVTVAGTLIIEPGTKVWFYPHGTLIDSVGGRIIADGYAKSTYNSSLDPRGPINGVTYAKKYADPAYFLLDDVMKVKTVAEQTINTNKYNYTFNVVLDTVNNRLENLDLNAIPNPATDKKVVIPFEKAMSYMFSRIWDFNNNNSLNSDTLRRNTGTSINVTPAQIQFIGQPVENLAPEWGHIVILPGARTAFFRNCSFENFKKDTLEGKAPVYDKFRYELDPVTGTYSTNTTGPWDDLNKEMIKLTNGGGGVITTFSVRTWLVDCKFKKNTARYRGGALQVLQAPLGASYYPSVSTTGLGVYPTDKNSALVDQYYNTASTINSAIPMIDNLDGATTLAADNLSDADRQSIDDARIAMLLGRFRRLEFSNNSVVLANVVFKTLNTTPPVVVLQDDLDNPASFPYGVASEANGAFGGAVYISGWSNPNGNGVRREIEVGFGINNKIKMDGVETTIEPAGDYVKFVSNYTNNLQYNTNGSGQSNGSYGGAIFVKDYTSLVVAGEYTNNETKVYQKTNTVRTSPDFSNGGAIYVSSSYNRFQVRGGEDRGVSTIAASGKIFTKLSDGSASTVNFQNPTLFDGNKSGMGGAICLKANPAGMDASSRVLIGGSDLNLTSRDFGYNVKFLNNEAEVHGGAIYTARNLFLYGAGGAVDYASPSGVYQISKGYNTTTKLEFNGNVAGFDGGAINVSLQENIADEKAFVRVVRANFLNNKVGTTAYATANDDRLSMISGGGAMFFLFSEPNLMKAVNFENNTIENANGGAIALINPKGSVKRFFLSDMDIETVNSNMIATGYTSVDSLFTKFTNVSAGSDSLIADVRMLTRFAGNKALQTGSTAFLASQMGKGYTQVYNVNGAAVTTDVTRWFPYFRTLGDKYKYPENGIGLGGAIYVLESVNDYNYLKFDRTDNFNFNRVRFQENQAYTGAVVYSDIYDLGFVMKRCLATGNSAYSTQGASQNVITGSYMAATNNVMINNASSDLAPAIFYGDIKSSEEESGMNPKYYEEGNAFYVNNTRANSNRENYARFLIRLPDAPSSKGYRTGIQGIGFSDVNDLNGNYWGRTEASVNLFIPSYKILAINGADTVYQNPTEVETFFVAGDSTSPLPFVNTKVSQSEYNPDVTGARLNQGPFESVPVYSYLPIWHKNGATEDVKALNSIKDTLLMVGKVYDIHDKGADVKTADYQSRRMSPIEDFSVGLPVALANYAEVDSWRPYGETTTWHPYNGKYVRRFLFDPDQVEAPAESLDYLPEVSNNDYANAVYTHPIGYPVFLEANVDYTVNGADSNLTNDDGSFLNETVFFAINETTGDYMRINLEQISDADAKGKAKFRGRLDMIPDTTGSNRSARRLNENLPIYGVGTSAVKSILSQIVNNGLAEDIGTLSARKYRAPYTKFGFSAADPTRTEDIFMNRTEMPKSNRDTATFFAGEKYRALPVLDNDYVTIVSRTMLWSKGVDVATQGGIKLKVINGFSDPKWTGEVARLDTLSSNKNVITYVKEDVVYDKANPVINVTALDKITMINNPILQGLTGTNDSTALIYSNTIVDPKSSLNYWLKRTIIPEDLYETINGVKTLIARNGYISLTGTPSNPYVVPGGDTIHFSVSNKHPLIRLIDGMKANGVSDEVISKYFYVFNKYYNTESYSGTNARFLNQDTVMYNGDGLERTLTIVVKDSLPVLKSLTTNCVSSNGKYVIANLTDKLRMQFDITTDDELEDAAAAQATPIPWDFRYGKHSYGWPNISRRGDVNDTATIDYLDFSRPSWMADQYVYKYGSDVTVDPYASDFAGDGKFNVRIPASEAKLLLASPNQTKNGEMNLDTSFVIVSNDGHSGIAYFPIHVIVNVKPTITTKAFSSFAVEGEEFNYTYNTDPSTSTKIDFSKAIAITDPNLSDTHTFSLLYPANTADIPKDMCFGEADTFKIVANKLNRTKEWIKINPTSGLLYGTPDLRHSDPYHEEQDGDGNYYYMDTLVAAVVDNGGLSDVTTNPLTIKVIKVNQIPSFTSLPTVSCVDISKGYSDSVYVQDLDFLRPDSTTSKELTEVLSFKVSPDKFTAKYARLGGISGTDNSTAVVKITAPAMSMDDLSKLAEFDKTTNKLTITVVATDKRGAKATLTYRVTISQATTFTTPMVVMNQAYYNTNTRVLSYDSRQNMEFGTAPDATTGEQPNVDVKLDAQYCENELPIIPPVDVFDARWSISGTNGIIRNIFPDDANNTYYRGIFQAGGVTGGAPNAFPVGIMWRKSDIPAHDDAVKNPNKMYWYINDDNTQGTIFHYDMKTGLGGTSDNNGIKIYEIGTDTLFIQINRNTIDGFVIFQGGPNGVEENTNSIVNGISNVVVTPQPMNDNATVKFNVSEPCSVKLEVYDNLGNLVRNLNVNASSMGENQVQIEGSSNAGALLASGSYKIRLSSGASSVVAPLVIIR